MASLGEAGGFPSVYLQALFLGRALSQAMLLQSKFIFEKGPDKACSQILSSSSWETPDCSYFCFLPHPIENLMTLARLLYCTSFPKYVPVRVRCCGLSTVSVEQGRGGSWLPGTNASDKNH